MESYLEYNIPPSIKRSITQTRPRDRKEKKNDPSPKPTHACERYRSVINEQLK